MGFRLPSRVLGARVSQVSAHTLALCTHPRPLHIPSPRQRRARRVCARAQHTRVYTLSLTITHSLSLSHTHIFTHTHNYSDIHTCIHKTNAYINTASDLSCLPCAAGSGYGCDLCACQPIPRGQHQHLFFLTFPHRPERDIRPGPFAQYILPVNAPIGALVCRHGLLVSFAPILGLFAVNAPMGLLVYRHGLMRIQTYIYVYVQHWPWACARRACACVHVCACTHAFPRTGADKLTSCRHTHTYTHTQAHTQAHTHTHTSDRERERDTHNTSW